MILNRHLRALLKRLDLDDDSAPPLEGWQSGLLHLNDALRFFEDERYRLRRSLEIQAQEVQSLYKELVREREKLSSVLGCLESGLILTDTRGHLTLVNPEAEGSLGFCEGESSAAALLAGVAADAGWPREQLTLWLESGRALERQGSLPHRDGGTVPARYRLQALMRGPEVVGTLLLFEADQTSDFPWLTEKLATLPVLKPPAEVAVAAPPTPRPAPSPITPRVAVRPAPPMPAPPVPAAPPPEPAPDEEEAPTAGARAPQALNILVVEDEAPARQLLETELRALGHELAVARNSMEALGLLAEGPFDVIMSAFQTNQVNGVDLCRKVRAHKKYGRPYFILMTTSDRREEAARAVTAGVDSFLSKPVEARELAARLKVATNMKRRLGL